MASRQQKSSDGSCPNTNSYLHNYIDDFGTQLVISGWYDAVIAKGSLTTWQ